MATKFSPCKGSYVLNQFPSNVMFGMNGFHVSASGAIQGHHGPLVFLATEVYTDSVFGLNSFLLRFLTSLVSLVGFSTAQTWRHNLQAELSFVTLTIHLCNDKEHFLERLSDPSNSGEFKRQTA